MTGHIRDWLPVEAADREAVRAALRGAVAQWSQAWFARRDLVAASFTPTKGEPRGEDGGWRLYRGTVAIACSARAGGRLLDWALDANLDEAPQTKTDRQLIDAFERRMIDDLAARVEQTLGAGKGSPAAPLKTDAPLGDFGGLVIGIEEGGGRLLSLAIPLAVLLPLCRSSLSPAKRERVRLDGLTGALGSTTVTVEATLGAAEVALADLRALAPGDVLVLDTALSGTATIALPGQDQAFARARLSDIDGQMALTLQ